MKRNIVLIIFLLIFLLLAIPANQVHADLGPKPTMTFDIQYQTSSPLYIDDVDLLLCDDDQCTTFSPLENNLGPQNIACSSNDQCTSMAYGYSEYHKLVLRFSDGMSFESNVFTKKHFDANYEVIVTDDALIVEPKGGKFNPMGLAVLGVFTGTCLFALLSLGLLITLLIMAVKEAGQP